MDLVETAFSTYGDRMVAYMKKYPPQRNPETNYIRGYGVQGGKRTSEDLGARWNKRIVRRKKSLLMDIGNNASYGPFVQSLLLQASIHRDWWQTEQDMVDEFLDGMMSDLDRGLEAYIVRNKQ